MTSLAWWNHMVFLSGKASNAAYCACMKSSWWQCAEGHLFCFNCLRRRVEEFTFGGLQTIGPLVCMDTEGCTESFPASEVKLPLHIAVSSYFLELFLYWRWCLSRGVSLATLRCSLIGFFCRRMLVVKVWILGWQVRRALPAEILSKYEQRQAEDAVARAELPGLVRHLYQMHHL
jgi:hypothetical protein